MVQSRVERSRGLGVLRSLFVMGVASMAPCGFGAEGPSAVEPPAIVVRAVRPNQQASAVLQLFDGARAPSPAAAMAAWRAATANINQVGKPL